MHIQRWELDWQDFDTSIHKLALTLFPFFLYLRRGFRSEYVDVEGNRVNLNPLIPLHCPVAVTMFAARFCTHIHDGFMGLGLMKRSFLINPIYISVHSFFLFFKIISNDNIQFFLSTSIFWYPTPTRVFSDFYNETKGILL